MKTFVLMFFTAFLLLSQDLAFPKFEPYVSDTAKKLTIVQTLTEKDLLELGKESPARFLQIDRLAEKYPTMNPYTGMGNNPILFTDPTGDSISFAHNSINGTQLQTDIVNDLQTQTGLTLTVGANGQMTYAMDANGNPVIATDANGNQVGSATARNLIINGISNTQQVYVMNNNGSGSKGAGAFIKMDPTQISSFTSGVQGGLNPETLGTGMTFMHEMLHSNLGGNLRDPQRNSQALINGALGQVVPIMNTIRNELGSSFGQRTTYRGFKVNNNSFIPFDQSSKTNLLNNQAPAIGSMFIQF